MPRKWVYAVQSRTMYESRGIGYTEVEYAALHASWKQKTEGATGRGKMVDAEHREAVHFQGTAGTGSAQPSLETS